MSIGVGLARAGRQIMESMYRQRLAEQSALMAAKARQDQQAHELMKIILQSLDKLEDMPEPIQELIYSRLGLQFDPKKAQTAREAKERREVIRQVLPQLSTLSKSLPPAKAAALINMTSKALGLDVEDIDAGVIAESRREERIREEVSQIRELLAKVKDPAVRSMLLARLEEIQKYTQGKYGIIAPSAARAFLATRPQAVRAGMSEQEQYAAIVQRVYDEIRKANPKISHEEARNMAAGILKLYYPDKAGQPIHETPSTIQLKEAQALQARARALAAGRESEKEETDAKLRTALAEQAAIDDALAKQSAIYVVLEAISKENDPRRRLEIVDRYSGHLGPEGANIARLAAASPGLSEDLIRTTRENIAVLTFRKSGVDAMVRSLEATSPIRKKPGAAPAPVPAPAPHKAQPSPPTPPTPPPPKTDVIKQRWQMIDPRRGRTAPPQDTPRGPQQRGARPGSAFSTRALIPRTPGLSSLMGRRPRTPVVEGIT